MDIVYVIVNYTWLEFERRDINKLITSRVNKEKLIRHLYFFRVGILALHKTLSDRPRDPLVVASFSLAVHNGGNLLEAVNIARMISNPHYVRFPELLDPSGLDAKALEDETLELAESIQGTLLQMTDQYFVSKALADYPQAPHSDLVSFFSLDLYVYFRTMLLCRWTAQRSVI